jgi:hypothetical protein
MPASAQLEHHKIEMDREQQSILVTGGTGYL